jgi:septum formation protein
VIVLASASPRRREILAQLGVAFEVIASGVDEAILAGEAPRAYAARVARDKALDVARERAGFVLGADTIVEIDGRALGKPQGDDDACAMLRSLSGRSHHVSTAIALCAGGRVVGERLVTTRVDFRALSEAMIARYVATGEGRDKAGSYAIQGLGAGLVTAIEGSYGNVVGLPAAETVDLLLEHGALHDWP